MFQTIPDRLRQTDPDYLSPHRARQAQEIYQELQEMDNQLKIWEMIIDFLGSGDFLLIILTMFIGVALVKSVGVVDRYINVTKRKDDNDEP
jgi:hypothetical protein